MQMLLLFSGILCGLLVATQGAPAKNVEKEIDNLGHIFARQSSAEKLMQDAGKDSEDGSKWFGRRRVTYHNLPHVVQRNEVSRRRITYHDLPHLAQGNTVGRRRVTYHNLPHAVQDNGITLRRIMYHGFPHVAKEITREEPSSTESKSLVELLRELSRPGKK